MGIHLSITSAELHGDHFIITSSTSKTTNLSGLVKSQIVLSGDHTDSVGVSHTSTPSLHTDDALALLEDSQADGVLNSPLETVVDILLPRRGVEVGLLLVVVEGVDAAVQVGVAGCAGVAGDHDDGAYWAILGDQTSGITPKFDMLAEIAHC